MLNKAMHKTRLTQNNKAKHTSNAKKKNKNKEKKKKKKKRMGEREIVTESLGAFFLPHLGRIFPFSKPLIWR